MRITSAAQDGERAHIGGGRVGQADFHQRAVPAGRYLGGRPVRPYIKSMILACQHRGSRGAETYGGVYRRHVFTRHRSRRPAPCAPASIWRTAVEVSRSPSHVSYTKFLSWTFDNIAEWKAQRKPDGTDDEPKWWFRRLGDAEQIGLKFDQVRVPRWPLGVAQLCLCGRLKCCNARSGRS